MTSVTDTAHHSALNAIARAKRYSHLVVWIVGALLIFRFCHVVAKYAVNLFFFDEWDVYDGLFQDWPWWHFFLQEHGPHRQGLGVTVVVWLLRATHWDSRVQSYAIASAIVLAMLAALWLKTRVFGALQLSDVIIPILFMGLGQWEILLSAPGPSAQAFPLLLLIAYCIAWTQESSFWRYVGVLVLNFLLIYTGYGIFVAVISLALLALDSWHTMRTGKNVRAPATAWIASAAPLGSFFYRYVFNPAASCYHFPAPHPTAYLWFIGVMFAKFLGIKHSTSVPLIAGLVFVIAIVYTSVRSWSLAAPHLDRREVVISILTTYTLVYAAAAAIGRVCLGMEAAGSSRNLTLLIPGFLGIYFCLLAGKHNHQPSWMIAALFLAVLPGCLQRNHKEIEGFSEMKRAWKSCYLSTENINYCDAVSHFQIYPSPEATHLRQKLHFLKQNHLNLYADPD